MQVTFDGTHPRVRDAVGEANGLLVSPAFLDDIAAHPAFDMSDASPAVIAGLMRSSSLIFKTTLFFPRGLNRWRYRKTFAYTDGRWPNTLFLHGRKLDREVADIAATIVHESIHALDASVREYRFGHGDNSPDGKENTAPYWIGNRAYQVLTNRPGATVPSIEQVLER